jgi:hypothetical protein
MLLVRFALAFQLLTVEERGNCVVRPFIGVHDEWLFLAQ